jgi:hypothetical protein
MVVHVNSTNIHVMANFQVRVRIWVMGEVGVEGGGEDEGEVEVEDEGYRVRLRVR